jgi:PAS domain S-box-containing protein
MKDNIFKWSNAKLREITGYEEDELEGKSCRLLYPDNDEHDWAKKTIHNQIVETGTGNIDTVWKRKNGKLIRVLLSASPLDPLDWSKGTTFAATDITMCDE